MAPKKAPVEEPIEPEEPELVEGDESELETGLKLPLTPNDVGRVWALDCAGQSKMLTELLGLEAAHPPVARREIICDFHLFNLSHAKKLCLTQRQGAVFHAIMAVILDMMAGWNTEEGATAAECFKEFQRLLLNHSVNDPPQRLAIFGGAEARRLTDYTSGTLFKHFLLYQFCARCERDVETLRFSVEVERPILPPSLANARQKPGRRPQQTPENPEDGTGTSTEEKTAGGAGEDLSEEIQRIVEEKLRLTEARLEAKLAEREQQFMERLAKK